MGGVARNVAEAILRLGGKPLLAVKMGQDHLGAILQADCASKGLLVQNFGSSTSRTAVCSNILTIQNNLHAGIADMGIADELEFSEVIWTSFVHC